MFETVRNLQGVDYKYLVSKYALTEPFFGRSLPVELPRECAFNDAEPSSSDAGFFVICIRRVRLSDPRFVPVLGRVAVADLHSRS